MSNFSTNKVIKTRINNAKKRDGRSIRRSSTTKKTHQNVKDQTQKESDSDSLPDLLHPSYFDTLGSKLCVGLSKKEAVTKEQKSSKSKNGKSKTKGSSSRSRLKKTSSDLNLREKESPLRQTSPAQEIQTKEEITTSLSSSGNSSFDLFAPLENDPRIVSFNNESFAHNDTLKLSPDVYKLHPQEQPTIEIVTDVTESFSQDWECKHFYSFLYILYNLVCETWNKYIILLYLLE